MESKELRQKTKEELVKLLQEKQARLGEINFQMARGEVKNVRERLYTRKDIARISTLMNENYGAKRA